MSGFSLCLIGLGFGIAIGIVIGVCIDTDTVIRGKIKQRTGRGGRSNINDVTVNVKKQTRKEKREQRKLKRNINK